MQLSQTQRMRARFLMNRVVNFIRPKPRTLPLSTQDILANSRAATLVEQVNDLFYTSGVASGVEWQGVPLLKNPCDLWTYIELMQRLKPTAIVETGTHHGGSAGFFADIMAIQGVVCTVVTVDLNPKWSFDPASKNIVSIVGYSVDGESVRRVRTEVDAAQARRAGPVLVTLDSDHSEANVTRELELYAPLVTRDSYVVVEDTNINGHPSLPDSGPGPWEAVEKFLAVHDAYVPDAECQRFLLTSNPRGWLKRVK